MALHTKRGDRRAVAHELSGLAALAKAAHDGGAPVARVASGGAGALSTYVLRPAPPTPGAAREFGARLAHTHAYAEGARVFGQAPDGFDGEVGAMGMAPLPLVAAGSPARRFGEFYAADRLLPYVDAALANGSFTSQDAAVIEKLAGRLCDGVFDSPQPELVRTDAALLHGDLWSGNLLWSRPDSPMEGGVDPAAPADSAPGGAGVVGVLIDPACQGGHAESDLAQLTVFGAPFAEEIYAGYDEASPLAPGWRERIGLHRLHMLIVHAALFGGGYGRETVATARPYL
ncbi:fructosamine kinase family protein [Trueperella abortisuis]|uniref:fructosamine kinase family protein n=1 Tax=Trueperella abortisuis TaxID=445930 RepID=UPI002893266A|nr:fructosamine kinase family protein [Trueperella abortisuis]